VLALLLLLRDEDENKKSRRWGQIIAYSLVDPINCDAMVV